MADFIVTVDGKYIFYGISLNLAFTLVPLPFDVNINKNFDYLDFDIVFNDRTGRVQDMGEYMALYNTKTHRFMGYIKVETFWETAGSVKDTYVTTAGTTDIRVPRAFKYIPLMPPQTEYVEPESGDRIILCNRQIADVGGTYKIKIGIKSFDYPGRYLDYVLDSNGADQSTETYANIQSGTFANYNYDEHVIDFVRTDLSTYLANVQSVGFKRPSGSSTPLFTNEINIVEDVALIFDSLFRLQDFVDFIDNNGLTYIFEKHFALVTGFDLPTATQAERNKYYDGIFNPRYFDQLRVRLLEFFHWAKGGGYWFVSKTDMLTRIYGLFDDLTLSEINFEAKKELLYYILENNFWISGRWFPSPYKYKLTKEELIVKIIRSIAREDNGTLVYSEINEFMDILNNIKDTVDTSKNLFQVLYDSIQDDILFGDDGNGARGKFVKAVFLLWMNSKYNPNSAENELVSVNYNYTSYNAMWKFEDPQQTQEYDTGAAPNMINYESDKFLLWYVDNFEFVFEDRKIVAKQETLKSPSEIAMESSMSNGYYAHPTKYVPYGYYDIFQPVSIKSSDAQDTIIRIPISGDLNNPCGVDATNNANSIPIFYLKYIDDLGDYSDFKQTVGVVTDVVLTFTGIGNITKARHLLKASVLRRFLLGETVTLLEKQVLVRALRGLTFATWETVLGTASTIYNLITDGCQNYLDPCNPPQPGTPQYDQFQKCIAMQKWLFALEILTMSGDILAKRFFRRASRDVAPHVANDLSTTEKQFIDGLADLDNALADFLTNIQGSHPSVHGKVTAFTTQEKKFQFFADFENDIDALNEFEASPHLIDEAWAEIGSLSMHRRNVFFLKAYHFIAKDTRCARLREHIFQGHYSSATGKVTGMHHIHGNVSSNAYGRIDNILDNSDIRGHYTANISISDGNGNFIAKVDNAGNPIINDMFSKSWTEQDVLENMSLAFTNKTYTGNRNKYLGTMSDGKGLILCIDNNAATIDATTVIKTVWPQR